jgi:transposase
MDITSLLADPGAINLDLLVSEVNSISLVVRTVQTSPCCPKCGQASSSLHSHYQRTVADLPWHGVSIKLQLGTRKLRCQNALCSQKVFCERLPRVVAAYARKTVRLNSALRLLAFALGGAAGARAACGLGLHASGDTLLRRIRQTPLSQAPTPAALGGDDWAKRRGRSYGTILVDLERRRPIELLPDREAGTLTAWLKEHKGVEVATRDRATYYADGITAGAPNVLQVADRFHLMKNLREVVERVLNAQRKALRAAALALSPHRALSQSLKNQALPPLHPKSDPSRRSAKELLQQQARRERRIERYEEIKLMHAAGSSISAIARRLGMQRATVRMFLRADEYPEARHGSQPSKVQPFAEYLRERWLAGCHNARQLYREIKAQGYRGHVKVLQAYLEPWREMLPEAIRRMHGVPEVRTPAPRMVAWWLLLDEGKLKDEERAFVAQITSRGPEIRTAQKLAREFQRLLRSRDEPKMDAWFKAVEGSNVVEFKNFAKGLRRDEAAVRAAMKTDWSNGQTEGQVNRLKLLKRQMYGRAKFDLLRARVLYAG